jgi:hypothetical protein
MFTIRLSELCEVDTDDAGVCVGRWIPGTFAGVLSVRQGCERLALLLPRTVHQTTRENGRLLAATANMVNSLREVIALDGAGLVQPIGIADLARSGDLIFVNMSPAGRPRMTQAKWGAAGIELAPPVEELRAQLTVDRWREFKRHDWINTARAFVQVGPSDFWYAASSLVVFPWAVASFSDTSRNELVGQWKAVEYLSFMRTLLTGLCRLHVAGLVHGDIRPCNILSVAKPECPHTYALAEFGRFASTAALALGGTYILPGARDVTYSRPGHATPRVVRVEVVLARAFREEIRLIGGTCEDLLDGSTPKPGLFDNFLHPGGEVLASEGHLLLAGQLAFDSKATWHVQGRVMARCQSGQWTVEGRFMSPESVARDNWWRINEVLLVHRASAKSDLYALGMVVLEALCGGEVFQEIVANLLAHIADVDDALLQGQVDGLSRILSALSIDAVDRSDSLRFALILQLVVFCLNPGIDVESGLATRLILDDNYRRERALGLVSQC